MMNDIHVYNLWVGGYSHSIDIQWAKKGGMIGTEPLNQGVGGCNVIVLVCLLLLGAHAIPSFSHGVFP